MIKNVYYIVYIYRIDFILYYTIIISSLYIIRYKINGRTLRRDDVPKSYSHAGATQLT